MCAGSIHPGNPRAETAVGGKKAPLILTKSG